MKNKLWDIVVIGGGPAGVATGIYAGRSRLDTLLIERGLIGGNINNTEKIENYPGFPGGIAAFDLAARFKAHAEEFGMETINTTVTGIGRDGKINVIETEDGQVRGKAVIIGDPGADKTEALLEAFGRVVDGFGGRYICGEDVGTTPRDMVVINRATAHVAGLPETSGDTAPATAYGVFQAMRAAVRRKLDREDFAGLRVAVQGLGSVGYRLCLHLADHGAILTVADIDGEAVARTNYGVIGVKVWIYLGTLARAMPKQRQEEM